MNRQEVFNKVWDHFIVQQNPFGWNGQGCTYLSPDGTRCAIGILMPEGPWQECEEGIVYERENGEYEEGWYIGEWTLDQVFNEEISFKMGLFLDELQSAHDESAQMYNEDGCRGTRYDQFERYLRSIANQYNLAIPRERWQN